MAIDKYPRVCISAGHGEDSRRKGSTDPGANIVGKPYEEADVTLSVAKSVHGDLTRLFAAKGRGRAYLRDAGAYYLADDYAVKYDCDIFIELHTDSSTNKNASGTSCLYESSRSKDLASVLSMRVARALGITNRGEKLRTDLAVLSPHSGMKQVLLEMFFGSNKGDVAAYQANRDAVVLAIVNSALTESGWAPLKKRPRYMNQIALRLYKPF